MKNKEAYKIIIDLITENGKYGYRVDKKTNIISSCDSKTECEYCESCLFYKQGDIFYYDECSKKLIEAWENTEYGEPFTPCLWYYVPIDTKIRVLDKNGEWINAHFAKYENGQVYTYACGKTSWTQKNEPLIPWNKARLLEGMC